jgi:hypothetical protein
MSEETSLLLDPARQQAKRVPALLVAVMAALATGDWNEPCGDLRYF